MKTVLSRYSIEENLNTESSVVGAPSLYSGFDLTTDATVIVKMWPRQSVSDDDLLLLWEAELRQMQHLAGLPGATDYLLPMHDAGVDDEGFYLILAAGDVRPLDWHKNQSSRRNKLSLKHSKHKLIWSNLRRIAKGLGILHSQGLIHRNICESSVFTENGSSADFRLGGFEWNIRLNTFGGEVLPIVSSKEGYAKVSFQQDWQGFAQLALRLLGINVEELAENPLNDRSVVDETLRFSEQHLLRKLIHPVPNDRPDTELVLKLIDKIISEYSTSSIRDKLTLCLIYNHQRTGSSLIRLLIEDGFEQNDVTDTEAIIDFVRQDLLEAEFMELHQDKQGHHRFSIIGHNYVYLLKEHTQHAWHFPQISMISRNMPSASAICSRKVLPHDTVLLRTPRQLVGNIIDLRVEADRWDKVFEDESPGDDSKAHLKFSHDAYLWLYLIEALQQTAETWTVEVMDVREESVGKYTYRIRFIEDDQRRKLSDALNLKTPLDRLIERLENPDDENETNWCVIQQGLLTHSRELSEITFDEFLDEQDGEERFRFSGSIQWSINEKLSLRPVNAGGDSKSMRRRKKLIARLADQDELLTALNSPLITARKSHNEKPVLDPELLDDSKQTALLEMINVLPIYLLQGPPGTGKTHLVSQLVKLIMAKKRSPRLLISAQGHDPVNHLMSNIVRELEQVGRKELPLMVRSRGRRGERIEGSTQLKQQAIRLMDRVMGSQLYKKAPDKLKFKIDQLRSNVQKLHSDAHFPDKAFESLIFRSANIVFSTTNSSDLEEMVDMSTHFDWSIIEEAGRATGVELLAPLMLSHRRLLIGDSQQLPSFGEDQIKRLLNEPQSLRDALVEGRPLLDSSFNDIPLDDLLEKFEDPMFAARMVREVKRHLTLFASLHDELYRHRGALPLAGRLNEQYRMRPEIADMVSKVFYKSDLKTPKQAPVREAQPPFQTTNAKRLPLSEIVIIDTPYWHRPGGAWARDKAPAHHNPGEVGIVLKVLSLIRCPKNVEKPAKLAVLTPYNRQVIQLKRAIAEKAKTELSHLKRFDTGIEMVQTIDSFQGKEADIVVVSLVRNNAHTWKRALGILADFRRMNVLLSRAKFKLVIVGSLEFLKLRFLPGKTVDESDELYFLHKWLHWIDENSNGPEKARSVSVITPSQLNG